MSDQEIHHDDGRVELKDPTIVEGTSLHNHDLAPVPIARRSWNTWDYAALWISMAHCIPTYKMASDLLGTGMSWWQALLTILLGNLIVLAPILLNSHPGTKYGIPFPVFARAAYGTVGSNLPALMRAVVACGWFGINTWIGGKALHVFFGSLWPGWKTLLPAFDGYPGTQWFAFALFWGLNILIIYRGMDVLRRIERFAAPFVLVMTIVLVVWAIYAANGLGPIMAGGSKLDTASAFLPVFIPALTGTVGFWSTLSLNMPDFTRFGRSQREQAIGQVVALPTTMTLFAGMGILITSATVIIFKKQISDPIDLGEEFSSRVIVGIAMFTIVIATLAVNIAANVVSPANDFVNAFPKKLNFQRGGLITGIVGIAMMPWEILKDANSYVIGWLVGYSGSLGSIAGVLVIDYWVLRKKQLDLVSLYKPDGAYRYSNGWNVPAVVATLAGTLVALSGLLKGLWPPLHWLYDASCFVGFAIASLLYYVLMKPRMPR